jgi:hypothetical protein
MIFDDDGRVPIRVAMVGVLLAVAGTLFVALQLGCCAQRESVLEDRSAVSKCAGGSLAGEQSQCGPKMAGADNARR